MFERNLDISKRAAIFCFSHLRWDFVYQRPQHLLSRCQRVADVYYWEEPVIVGDRKIPSLKISRENAGVRVLTPLLPAGLDDRDALTAQRRLLDGYVVQEGLSDLIAWYYTPMALPFSDHLDREVTVYDCMDELSAFEGAPPELVELEECLFEQADVVFAGGASLYEAKRARHSNVHLFPSSVDHAHFAASRLPRPDPPDQKEIPHPRIGYYGVLDERLDRELLRSLSEKWRNWQFVLIGPTAKIRAEDLPQAANIHYLGLKEYRELPLYLAHWDVAMMPFALNSSTKFISPTKTPEYLSADKPVVSTPIRDVVKPYGEMGFVKIGRNVEEFGAAIEACLKGEGLPTLAEVDQFLAETSWDKTFQKMWDEIRRSTSRRAVNDITANGLFEGAGADV